MHPRTVAVLEDLEKATWFSRVGIIEGIRWSSSGINIAQGVAWSLKGLRTMTTERRCDALSSHLACPPRRLQTLWDQRPLSAPPTD